jgi:hypothetical protein
LGCCHLTAAQRSLTLICSVSQVLNGQFLFFPGEGPSSNFNLYFTGEQLDPFLCGANVPVYASNAYGHFCRNCTATAASQLYFADADYTALAGGTLFWFGAYFAVVEALNVGHKVRRHHHCCFQAEV